MSGSHQGHTLHLLILSPLVSFGCKKSSDLSYFWWSWHFWEMPVTYFITYLSVGIWWNMGLEKADQKGKNLFLSHCNNRIVITWLWTLTLAAQLKSCLSGLVTSQPFFQSLSLFGRNSFSHLTLNESEVSLCLRGLGLYINYLELCRQICFFSLISYAINYLCKYRFIFLFKLLWFWPLGNIPVGSFSLLIYLIIFVCALFYILILQNVPSSLCKPLS